MIDGTDINIQRLIDAIVAFPIFVLLWTIFVYCAVSIGVAVAAHERGRNWLVWLLAGLAFSPLLACVLLLTFPELPLNYAAAPMEAPAPAPAASATGMRKHCRYCGNLTPTSSITCIHCGRQYP